MNYRTLLMAVFCLTSVISTHSHAGSAENRLLGTFRGVRCPWDQTLVGNDVKIYLGTNSVYVTDLRGQKLFERYGSGTWRQMQDPHVFRIESGSWQGSSDCDIHRRPEDPPPSRPIQCRESRSSTVLQVNVRDNGMSITETRESSSDGRSVETCTFGPPGGRTNTTQGWYSTPKIVGDLEWSDKLIGTYSNGCTDANGQKDLNACGCVTVEGAVYPNGCPSQSFELTQTTGIPPRPNVIEVESGAAQACARIGGRLPKESDVFDLMTELSNKGRDYYQEFPDLKTTLFWTSSMSENNARASAMGGQFQLGNYERWRTLAVRCVRKIN